MEAVDIFLRQDRQQDLLASTCGGKGHLDQDAVDFGAAIEFVTMASSSAVEIVSGGVSVSL